MVSSTHSSMRTEMMEAMGLTCDSKWKAIAQRDKACDGLFFYGVKTTGIFCRPSCGARNPKQENTLYFADAAEARQAGFRPCKKCRPDLMSYDPDGELVERARKRLDESFAQPHPVDSLLQELCMSRNHFIRLFKQCTGCTPNQYLTRQRIAQAMRLLDDKTMSVLAVALACGFESLSPFYKSFKAQTGKTPTAYRKKGETDYADRSV